METRTSQTTAPPSVRVWLRDIVKLAVALYLGWLAVWSDWTSEESFQRKAMEWVSGAVPVSIDGLVLVTRIAVSLIAASVLIWFGWSVSGRRRLSGAERRAAHLKDELDGVREQLKEAGRAVGQLETDNERLRGKIEELTPETPPEPTERELIAIDDVLVLWRVVGKDATWAAFQLLGGVEAALEGRNPLAPLIDKESRPLNKARAPLVQLDAGETMPLEDVRNAFAECFRLYMRAVRWYHLAGADPAYIEVFDEHKGLYEEWAALHDRFQTEANRTLKRALLEPLRYSIESTGWQTTFNDDTFGFRGTEGDLKAPTPPTKAADHRPAE